MYTHLTKPNNEKVDFRFVTKANRVSQLNNLDGVVIALDLSLNQVKRIQNEQDNDADEDISQT
jgi:hypothetical protein